MRTLEVTGLSFKLCVYLSTRPGIVLFSDDITRLWPVRNLTASLRAARGAGWITAQKVHGEKGLAFSAGPELTKLMETP